MKSSRVAKKSPGSRPSVEWTVERTEDPEYPGEVDERESFLLQFDGTAKPASANDLAALRAFHASNELPNRLEAGRRGLLMIAGTPEHKVGAKLLQEAERAWQQVKAETSTPGVRVRAGDSAHKELDHLIDVVRAGLRRQDARPILSRDAARQDGTRKPRRPEIDAWIEATITNDPTAARPELWELAPGWIRDEIGKDRFLKRVSKARKRAASK